ncbi:MAG: type pilus assembly protein PilN [Actinomycetota bacterium]|jgi:Tfp pilus assembly protein PilN|nr:type pilus assembly protein PilN [Actinomycetota bacterium]
MSTKTLNRTSTIPIVNLLPPEVGEQRRLRKLQAGLGAAVAATVGIVVALYVVAAADVSRAQDDLAATQAQGAELQVETAKYANVPAVIAKVDAAKLQRSEAMSQEIRWSFYLNDLSLRIPSKVWLTKITATQQVDVPTVAPVGGATYPDLGIGNVAFEGTAYGHNDVASWLQMLAGQEGWTQAYFTNSAEDDSLTSPGGDPAVKFTSQVTVTKDALSGRFDQKAGS